MKGDYLKVIVLYSVVAVLVEGYCLHYVDDKKATSNETQTYASQKAQGVSDVMETEGIFLSKNKNP